MLTFDEEVLATRRAKAAMQRRRRNLGETRSVSEFGDDYNLVQTDIEVKELLADYTDATYDDYQYLFEKVGNAEVLELWGVSGTPYMESTATLLYRDSRTTTEQKSGFNIAGEKDTRYFPKPKKESGSGWTPFGTQDERYL